MSGDKNIKPLCYEKDDCKKNEVIIEDGIQLDGYNYYNKDQLILIIHSLIQENNNLKRIVNNNYPIQEVRNIIGLMDTHYQSYVSNSDINNKSIISSKDKEIERVRDDRDKYIEKMEEMYKEQLK